MADRPVDPEPGNDAGLPPGPAPAGMPRWVKVFLVVAILLVLAFIGSRLLGVEHGPGLHNTGGSAAPTASLELGI